MRKLIENVGQGKMENILVMSCCNSLYSQIIVVIF